MIYRIESINDNKFTDELFFTAYQAMEEERQQKADRYKHIQNRKLCVFSDFILREMLKEDFGVCNPEFYIEQSGKPALKGGTLHFNISHSKNYIACAVDTKPVGIDIETYRGISAPLIKRVCTKEELEYIFKDSKEINNTDTVRRFFSVWTAKEAYLKCTGKGLSGGLKGICVATKDGIKEVLTPNHKLLHITTNDYALSVVECI